MHETTPLTAAPPAAPRWSRLRRAAGGAGVALLVGGATGVVVRLLMRAVAVVLGHEPSMSLVATAAIVLLFAIGLVPAAVLLALGLRKAGLGVLAFTTLLHLSQVVVVGLDEGGAALVDEPSPVTVAILVAFLLAPLAGAFGVWRLTSLVAARPAPRHAPLATGD